MNSALNQLIAAREADGFVVTTYAVPAGTSRDSIKAYIQSLWGTGNAPNYILIVGDTSGATSANHDDPALGRRRQQGRDDRPPLRLHERQRRLVPRHCDRPLPLHIRGPASGHG